MTTSTSSGTQGICAPDPAVQLDIDVVVVSYNSRAHLRPCVADLAELDGVSVFVVDSDSTDGSLETIEDLPVTVVPLGVNRGFGYGCNVGWRAGGAAYVLFLNPDARLDRTSLARLASVLDEEASIGAVAPRVDDPDGALDFSLRRFARLRSTYARAVFLHRIVPHASWSDELIRDERAYCQAHDAEWVSGACILVRRRALEAIEGLDEGFFLYREDMDLCRRLLEHGFRVRFEPAARAVHAGGASAPRTRLYPVLAASRVRYARKHHRRLVAELERGGVALEALTHMVACKGGREARLGHAAAFRAAVRARAHD